jgi:hypothetical protein
VTKKTKTVLLVVVGLIICVGIVGVGAAVWFFTSAFETVAADETRATRSFEEVRARFGGAGPVLRMTDDGPVVAREPPQVRPARDLQSVHLLAWNPQDERLATFTLPFWLMRMKEGPIDISAESAGWSRSAKMSMTVEELERYGPALLIDHADEDDGRILVWTE